LGFEVYIIEDAVRAIDSKGYQTAMKDFEERGGKRVSGIRY
jgi:nicotinamidase-related amidase